MFVQFSDPVSRYFIEWPGRGLMTSSGYAHLEGRPYDMACREPASGVAEDLGLRSVYGAYRVYTPGRLWIDSNCENWN